ncbi:MAG: hypothetical protein ABL974_23460 [Prosthecobacter sp.]
MSTLIEIEHAIEKLPSSDLRKLHCWIAERDAHDWDAEIAKDATAGKFDALRQRVSQDNEAGLCHSL